MFGVALAVFVLYIHSRSLKDDSQQLLLDGLLNFVADFSVP